MVEIGNEDANAEDDHEEAEPVEESNNVDADDADAPNEFDEDDFDDIADNFESSYNFRFEEPCVPSFYLVETGL